MPSLPNGVPPSFQFQPRASDLLHHIPHTMGTLHEHEDPRIETELVHLAHMLEQRDRQVENFLSSSKGQNYAIYTYIVGAQAYSAATPDYFGGSTGGQIAETWILPCTSPTLLQGSQVPPAGFGTVWVQATLQIADILIGVLPQTYFFVDQPQIMAERIPMTGTGTTLAWIFERSLQRTIVAPIVPPPLVGLDVTCLQPFGSTRLGPGGIGLSGATLLIGYSN